MIIFCKNKGNYPVITIYDPYTRYSLTHIDCYMDDVISAVQDRPERQHQVFDDTGYALKWLLPLPLGDSKDSMSVQNFWKEKANEPTSSKSWGGILTRRRKQSPSHSAIFDNYWPWRTYRLQNTIWDRGRKELERLVGKLCSMHLAVPRVVVHIYQIQRYIDQGEVEQSWLSPLILNIILKVPLAQTTFRQ